MMMLIMMITLRYVHTSTGREPLRHLPPAMIAQLQQQLSAQVGDDYDRDAYDNDDDGRRSNLVR